MCMLTIIKNPLSSEIASAVETNRSHNEHRREPYGSCDDYGLPMPFSVLKVRYDSLQTGQELCFARDSRRLTAGGSARGCLLS
jgi:hypothetical protein